MAGVGGVWSDKMPMIEPGRFQDACGGRRRQAGSLPLEMVVAHWHPT